jgi:hypothetical protein
MQQLRQDVRSVAAIEADLAAAAIARVARSEVRCIRRRLLPLLLPMRC